MYSFQSCLYTADSNINPTADILTSTGRCIPVTLWENLKYRYFQGTQLYIIILTDYMYVYSDTLVDCINTRQPLYNALIGVHGIKE